MAAARSERFAGLLERGQRDLRSLTAAEVDQLGQLYRAITSDLAVAQRDAGTV